MGTPARFTGTVLTPGDAGFEDASRTWNACYASRPREVMVCHSAEAVAEALGSARGRGIPFRVRSGGHSMAGLSSVADGAIIDLGGLDAITLSEDSSLVTVGGGARLGDIYRELWKAGVTVPAGTCPRIGIGGHVLGGGMGVLSRSRGALVDHLVGLELVGADGRLRQVDDDEHADLFWACRGGGGGSFGIATSYTFRTSPISEVTIFTIAWSWAQFAPAVKAWQGWLASAEDRINTFLSLFPRQQDLLVAFGVFDGPAAEFEELLRPLVAAAEPQTLVVEPVPFIQAVDTVEALQGEAAAADQVRAQGSSAIVAEPLNEAAIATLQEFLTDPPSHRAEVAVYGMGGAIGHRARTDTAFVHRTGLMAFEYRTDWDLPEDDGKNLAWVRALRHSMAEHTTGAAYVNTIDLALENWLWAYYEENLPRLMQVKRQYDPGDVFQHPHSIPVSLTAEDIARHGIPEQVAAEIRSAGLLS
ncbi:FAD-binding oxidoreductase [Streptomyces olivochromogenes]|uniref:FAD-binding oxidoreductase n=1 Tax=Streptomyces olivochromogenes TaxID=1963 RepID=UPI001F261DFD|nr:FAD-binding oxidoreductase [Streptomyces olivochromogenes]MCF3131692.1 FAD-binding oxidoreductase [Streptomyces olivochromogenes]